MDLKKLIDAKIVLMEGKENRFSASIPGNDKIEVCQKAIESLNRHIQNIKDRPEDYKEDEGSHFQLTIELNKILD